jgi:hypothetical protein
LFQHHLLKTSFSHACLFFSVKHVVCICVWIYIWMLFCPFNLFVLSWHQYYTVLITLAVYLKSGSVSSPTFCQSCVIASRSFAFSSACQFLPNPVGILIAFSFFFLIELGIKLEVWCMLDKCSTTELCTSQVLRSIFLDLTHCVTDFLGPQYFSLFC